RGGACGQVSGGSAARQRRNFHVDAGRALRPVDFQSRDDAVKLIDIAQCVVDLIASNVPRGGAAARVLHGLQTLLDRSDSPASQRLGKKKDDKLDSEKIARLMRGGTFPLSYVYPREMRATRDLVRRRMFLVRRRSELLQHVQLINQQYNCDPFEKMVKYASNRDVLDRFEED